MHDFNNVLINNGNDIEPILRAHSVPGAVLGDTL